MWYPGDVLYRVTVDATPSNQKIFSQNRVRFFSKIKVDFSKIKLDFSTLLQY